MKKVLIIDDEEDIREILSEFSSMMGLIPVVAENGKEGFERFEKEKVNLIISDLKMPDMNGFEFVRRIREKDKKIPIVICSGFIDEKNREEILKSGANYYLEKPFKMKELKEIFEKIILD